MKLKAAAQPGQPNIRNGTRSITAEFAIDDTGDMNAQVIKAKAVMQVLLSRPGVNYVEGIFRIAGIKDYKQSVIMAK